MVNLLAVSADVMRQLAERQTETSKSELSGMADAIEDVAHRLVNLLFPDAESKQ